MANQSSALKNSILIVAHPDDEVLWFSSLLPRIDRVILIFQDYQDEPGLGERRRRALAELPYEITCLGIPEAGTYGKVNWDHPIISPYGLALSPEDGNENRSRIYKNNFHAMCALLEKQISANMTIFTHNPWGEYGHADHVQVHRAMESLRMNMNFTMRVSTYISRRSAPLAGIHKGSTSIEPLTFPIDTVHSNRIADIYKRHRCWTWADDWIWPKEETFIECPTRGTPSDSFSTAANSPFLRHIPSTVHDRLPRHY